MVNLIFNTNFLPEKNTVPCSLKTAVVLDDQRHINSDKCFMA
jgi:hypothetical protein